MKIGNKEYKTVTLELLKKLNACKEGIDFFRRNKLEGFPLSRLNEIVDDHAGFVSWLKKVLKVVGKWEFDQNDNVTKEVDSDGDVWKYEYDQNGNMTKKVNSDGNVWEFEYDQNGKRVKEVLPSGRVWSYEYDQNGNQTKEMDSFGLVWEREYDQNGNKTKEVYPSGSVWEYEYDQNGNQTKEFRREVCCSEYKSSFYSDGQLKSYGRLQIPFFEKPSETS